MGKHISIPHVAFLVGPDKVSVAARCARGVVIATQAPQSPLYVAHADLSAAGTAVTTASSALQTALDTNTQVEAAVVAQRQTLAETISQWDAAYSLFVAMTEKYAVTPSDAHEVGAVARSRTAYPLAAPIAVLAKYDAKNNLVRIRVQRAPGMTRVRVQTSPDPITATSWVELAGTAAVHKVTSPPKGTLWVRAQSLTASAESAFTGPVAVIIG